MDLFEKQCFVAALPDAPTFSEPDSAPQQQHYPSLDPFVFHEGSSGVPGVREMTRQQWETLKPLIKRVYIEENKPFPYLARKMREEHGFEPTKRQFARQIAKWGFRKNVPRAERRKILEQMPEKDDMNQLWFVQAFQDRRIKAGKLRNWRRRYRGEAGQFLMNLQPESGNQGCVSKNVVSIDEAEFPFTGGGLPIAKSELPMTEPPFQQYLDYFDGNFGVLSINKNLEEDTKHSRPSSSTLSPMDICHDSPHVAWSTVDVPGSPRMSRLFKRLEIESMVQIPPLSLDDLESDDSQCLSNEQVQEIFNKNDKTTSQDFAKTRLPRMRRFFLPPQKPEASNPHYPWRNIELIFSGYTASPLTEIYVFPPSPPRKAPCKRAPATPATPATCKYLETQKTQIQLKLAKLKSLSSEESPAVISSMNELAHVCGKLGHHREAEAIFRKLAEVHRQTLGPEDITTLEACQNVIKSLKEQSFYSKAKHLNDELKQLVQKLIDPNHPLAIRVSKMDAWLAEVLSGSQACESARREMLQMMLATHGPRHPDTMQALYFLGHTISQMGAEGGETLLRTALELSLQDPHQEDFVVCAVMLDLAYALNFNGAYEESYRVSINARERFSTLLSPEHMFFISLEEQLARSLLEIGKIAESESLFRHLVYVYEIRNLGTHNTDVSNAWCGLGNVFAEQGNRKEAVGWYEKYFTMRISSDRGTDSALMETGFKLLYCYQEQRRFADALKVYHQMMDKFPKSFDQDRFTMAWKRHLESEIRWIEAEMEHPSDGQSDSEGESSKSDWDSSDTE